MKICVVGGTGNISTPIVSQLLKLGHEVYCYNRGISCSVPEGAHSIVGDRNNLKSFEKIIQDADFDFAIDMICMNADQAMSSIRAFNGVKHFIMCSTVGVYGIENNSSPITEDQILKPETDYARNKVEAENLFMNAYQKKKFPVTILRPSTTYGSKMGLLRQISTDFSWIDRIQKSKPILICDDGSAKCQFMHVDDAATVFSSIIGKKESIGQVYNLVDKQFYTWNEYHKVAMKVLEKKVDLVEVAYLDLKRFKIPGFKICRDVFSHNLYFSSEKLFKLLPDFTPRISLEEGMKKVLKNMDIDGRIKNSYNQKWEDRIIKKKRKGSIKSGLFINNLLFNIDRITHALKKRLFKFFNVY